MCTVNVACHTQMALDFAPSMTSMEVPALTGWKAMASVCHWSCFCCVYSLNREELCIVGGHNISQNVITEIRSV